jgi:hypothetical protein
MRKLLWLSVVTLVAFLGGALLTAAPDAAAGGAEAAVNAEKGKKGKGKKGKKGKGKKGKKGKGKKKAPANTEVESATPA